MADYNNSRALEYDVPSSTDNTADHVFGRGGRFTTTLSSYVNAASLFDLTGLALDAKHNLYVADCGNNQVLECHAALPLRKVFISLVRQ